MLKHRLDEVEAALPSCVALGNDCPQRRPLVELSSLSVTASKRHCTVDASRAWASSRLRFA
jgi:hypothetical protein